MVENLISSAVASKTDNLPIAIGAAIGDKRRYFLSWARNRAPRVNQK